jgi:hypothetical protein
MGAPVIGLTKLSAGRRLTFNAHDYYNSHPKSCFYVGQILQNFTGVTYAVESLSTTRQERILLTEGTSSKKEVVLG